LAHKLLIPNGTSGSKFAPNNTPLAASVTSPLQNLIPACFAGANFDLILRNDKVPADEAE
jgi:hypothetical protein